MLKTNIIYGGQILVHLTYDELDFIIKKAFKNYKSPWCSPFRKLLFIHILHSNNIDCPFLKTLF